MSKEKIQKIVDTAKAEKRDLTTAEVKEIKQLEKADVETASSKKADADAKAGTERIAKEKADAKLKGKTKKVTILLPVAGKFKLSANVGEKVDYPIALAKELIEAKYAK